MRSIILAALVAVFLLGACAPGVGFEPIDTPEWGRSWPTERSPVPAVEEPVVEEPPVVTRPVEPQPPDQPEPPAEPLPVDPPGEPEPPEEPPESDPPITVPPEPAPPVVGAPEPPECRELILPPESAVERITKCPKQPADLHFR